MQRSKQWSVGLVVTLVLAGNGRAQTVDNPQYQQWSAWREGTSVTWKTESTTEGAVQVAVKQTQTLKSVTAEKAVLEFVTVTEAGGQTIKSDPVTMDIPAKAPKFDPPPGGAPNIDPKDTPKFKQTNGRETLTVNGKKLDCEWTKVEVEGGMVSTTWACDDVPAQMVKNVSTTPFGTTTMLLLEWKGGKK